MGKYYVNEPFDMGGRPTVEKDGKTVNIRDVVDEINALIEWQEKAFEAHPNIDIDIENLTT